MSSNPELIPEPIDFPERIGQDFELWQQYREVYGPEAYKFRRLFEETSQLLYDVYKYAEERGIVLPNTGPDFT